MKIESENKFVNKKQRLKSCAEAAVQGSWQTIAVRYLPMRGRRREEKREKREEKREEKRRGERRRKEKRGEKRVGIHKKKGQHSLKRG